MMRITSLIRMSFCTKLGRYGTLAPVLQIRLCLPPAITKVSPTVSFCLWLHSLPLKASCFSILLLVFLTLCLYFIFLFFSLSVCLIHPMTRCSLVKNHNMSFAFNRRSITGAVCLHMFDSGTCVRSHVQTHGSDSDTINTNVWHDDPHEG